MPHEIIPGQGLNVARFGEPKDVLRGRLGEFEEFRRTPTGPLIDDFLEEGIQLTYDSAGRLAFIECTPLADGVEFQGVPLLEEEASVVLRELEEQGVQGARFDAGFRFAELGFALFVPSPDEPDAEVQGVSVFPEGYYG